jgi:hypothetical protein
MRRAPATVLSRSVFSGLPSVVFVCLVLAAASDVHAQSSELVGIRAQGMAGAFTAVADDSSATWWNPAGLAGGAFINGIIEYDRPRVLPDDPAYGVSVAFPALGLSYYRLPLGQIRPPTSTAEPPGSRQDEGVLSVYGVTVGQSLGEHLVIGSTLKLATASSTEGGLDVGAMASLGRVRLAIMVRNAKEIEFEEGTVDAYRLRRQARAGAAFSSGARGVIGRATVAFDADLTSSSTAKGDVRRVAAGGEVWTTRGVIGLRGGISTSTIGASRTSVSGGVSVTVRSGTFVDAHITRGEHDSDHNGWGTALRVTF